MMIAAADAAIGARSLIAPLYFSAAPYASEPDVTATLPMLLFR